MSFISNLFDGADNAAAAQQQAIQTGLKQAGTQYGAANSALTTDYTKGLQPFLQNFGTATQGTGALGNVLGLNGPAGSQSALANLQTSPGYQFALGQGNNAINAAAAANGTLGSGNQATALAKFGSGLADQTYNNYVGQLQPYLGAASSAASGIGTMYGGLGNATSANDTGLGQLQYQGQVGIGNAQASADLADQSLGMGLLGGALNLGMSAIPGLGQIGTALGSGFGMSQWSDERLKDDIEPIGEMYDGQKLYRYKYIDDPVKTHIGVLAQEAAEAVPDAVGEFGGFLAVDYGRATNAAAELARFMS